MPLADKFLQSVETFASRDKLAPPWIRVATLMNLITFSDQGCYPNRFDPFLDWGRYPNLFWHLLGLGLPP